MKQNRSLFDKKKKKEERKGILGKAIVDDKIISIQSMPFYQKVGGFCVLVFLYAQKKDLSPTFFPV